MSVGRFPGVHRPFVGAHPLSEGFAVEVTAVNPPEHVFNQNEDVSRDMERVGNALAATT